MVVASGCQFVQCWILDKLMPKAKRFIFYSEYFTENKDMLRKSNHWIIEIWNHKNSNEATPSCSVSVLTAQVGQLDGAENVCRALSISQTYEVLKKKKKKKKTWRRKHLSHTQIYNSQILQRKIILISEKKSLSWVKANEKYFMCM